MEENRPFYLNIGYMLSLFIYLATCAALFFIDRRYAGTLGSGFLALAVIFPIVRTLARVFRKESAPKENSSEQKRIAATVIIIGLLFDAYLVYSDKFHIGVYLFMAVVIVAICEFIIEWRNGRKLEETYILGIVYSAIIISAVLFLVIVNPCPVRKAEKIIADRGYSEVSFLAGIRNKKPMLGGKPALSPGNKKGLYTFYHFEGEKNGESYSKYIDAISGAVIGEVKVNDGIEIVDAK